jgi:DNA-binding transcriptional ArsR family regulator
MPAAAPAQAAPERRLCGRNRPCGQAIPERHGRRRAPACLGIDVGKNFYIIGDMEKSDAVLALGALAQDTRLDVFRRLVQAGPEGLPAGQIAEQLGVPTATLSFHLTQLRQAGLITFRREGRSLIYAAEYAAMNALLAYLTENCCAGSAAAEHRSCREG